MRYEPGTCPICGKPARGTVETLSGIAEFSRRGDGEVEYSGYTDICWDGQRTVVDPQGRVTLICPSGHEWPASSAVDKCVRTG